MTVLTVHTYQLQVKTILSLGMLITLMALPIAGQVVGPEIPLSPPRPAPADHEQKFPAVATDGDIFLVAWTNHDRARAELYAARVTRSGQLLDEISFPIAIKPEQVFGPQVAWTGRVFLVMYGSVGKRISRDGRVLGEVRLPPGGLLSLTCNGSRCLAVSRREQLEPRALRGTLLDSDGAVIVEDFVMAAYSGSAGLVSSASNGTNFLVAWQAFDASSTTERQALYSRTVTNSGSLGQSRRIAVSQFELGFHDIESDGSGYLLAWTSGELFFRVQARRFNSSGNPSGDEVAVHSARRLGLQVLLARWGAGYVMLLLNQDRLMLEAFRVRTDGSMAGSDPFASWPVQNESAFAASSSGGEALVVWDTAPARTDTDMYASLLDSRNGAVTPTFLVSQTARPQKAPALALSGDSVFAVWEEHLPGKESQISGTFVGKGFVAPESEITPRPDHAHSPAMAYDGGKFLVTWTEGTSPFSDRRVMARVVSNSGQALGDAGVVAERSCRDSEVAASGDGFLVSWVDCANSGQLRGGLLNADGIVLSRFPITAGAMFVLPGGLAWGGELYLVTWSEGRPSPEICDPFSCVDYAIGAALVSREGLVLKTFQISNAGSGRPPQVAWDGTRFLVTWERNLIIEAARVGVDGSAEVPRRFSSLGAGPAVVWDGTAFVGVGIRIEDYVTGQTDLMMARVTHAQLDSGEGAPAVRLIETIDDVFAPAIVAIAPREVAIAYQRAAHEPEYGSANRVFVRFVAFPERRTRAIRR